MKTLEVLNHSAVLDSFRDTTVVWTVSIQCQGKVWDEVFPNPLLSTLLFSEILK